MPRQTQLSLFKSRLTHGGDASSGRRKEMRPLDPSKPVHVVLRSERARGSWSLLAPRVRMTVKRIVYRAGEKQKVRIIRYVNVGNHLHVLVKASSRKSFQNFLRQVSGHVAQAVTGARKGSPAERTPGERRRFWDTLAFTRVLKSRNEEMGIQRYFMKNLAETLGLSDPRAGYAADSAVLRIPTGAGPPMAEVWG